MAGWVGADPGASSRIALLAGWREITIAGQERACLTHPSFFIASLFVSCHNKSTVSQNKPPNTLEGFCIGSFSCSGDQLSLGFTSSCRRCTGPVRRGGSRRLQGVCLRSFA
jgi:hypothetical protein